MQLNDKPGSKALLPLNPYIAGNPVGDSPAFIGRTDVVRAVVRVLRRPQDNAIVLYGQRRIGKTSILQNLQLRLPEQGPYHPVYFDLQDKADLPLEHVLQDLADTIAHTLAQPKPELAPDPELAFHQRWLPTVLNNLPEGASLVLLFDEFDVLADPQRKEAAQAFFAYLRNLLASDRQRLQFIFVIGRNVDDLDNIALSLFKGIPYQHISLLKYEDTLQLARLSEANGSLRWPDEAAEQVWALTSGHPFLTQQLCSHVWERAYDDEPETQPVASADVVNAAIGDTLEASRNTLEWLWDGLGPAERVVASALAASGPSAIDQETLETLLQESGVRVVIRELQSAPDLLQKWDLIEPAEHGYRFRVELLRRWLAAEKPLRRVQEELDRIEPVAENFYRAALGLYRGGKLDEAGGTLRQAIELNPNHVAANQLLADILLAQGQPDEARQILERLYEYQPGAARPRLIQVLLAKAQAADNDADRLTLYEQVLTIAPTQQRAIAERQAIWVRRAEEARQSDDLEAAAEAYRQAGFYDKAIQVDVERQRRVLAIRLQQVEALEREKHYLQALELARQLAQEYPEVSGWHTTLERLEHRCATDELYRRALEALAQRQTETASELLAQVVAIDNHHEEVTRYLHLVATGVDPARLERERTRYRWWAYVTSGAALVLLVIVIVMLIY